MRIKSVNSIFIFKTRFYYSTIAEAALSKTQASGFAAAVIYHVLDTPFLIFWYLQYAGYVR